MRNKRIIERVKTVLGEDQLTIGEILDRLSQCETKYGKLVYYPNANSLSSIMRGNFEKVSIGSPKSKKNEWRNKNVMDRKIQTEEIE